MLKIYSARRHLNPLSKLDLERYVKKVVVAKNARRAPAGADVPKKNEIINKNNLIILMSCLDYTGA